MSRVIGWDIGGAHLKAALLEGENILKVMQIPCELWRGLDRLELALSMVLVDFEGKGAQHAITMTGELVDLFENRHHGVIEIANLSERILGKNTQFYAAGHGFVPLKRVSECAERIASFNWHASASWLAKHVENALFVDIGSTTTDIISIVDGEVAEIGLTDGERMQEDTLVYRGVVRTPIMALASKLLFNGIQTNVAAEYFATTADVYRLTGDLKQEMDMTETADGKGKSQVESARRLARMIGRDAEDWPISTWQNFAIECKETQMQQMKQSILKHLKTNMPIVGAGAGVFLVKQLAEELKCEYMSLSQVTSFDFNDSLEVCFPAFAVAKLASE
jgi:probable H4MPT-linked C1 transfer pathway protein